MEALTKNVGFLIGCRAYRVSIQCLVSTGGRAMDPVTLILAALVAGATKVAGDLLPDAYQGLKGLILRKFAGNAKAEQTLADHEEDPNTFEKPMAKQLEETGAAADPDIIAAAEGVLEAAKAAGIVQVGKYNVNVTGGNVGAIGDGAHVQM